MVEKDSSYHLSCGYFWDAFRMLLRGSSRIEPPGHTDTTSRKHVLILAFPISLLHTSASWSHLPSRPHPSNPCCRLCFHGDPNQDGMPVSAGVCELRPALGGVGKMWWEDTWGQSRKEFQKGSQLLGTQQPGPTFLPLELPHI